MKPILIVIATLFSVAVSAQKLIAVQNGNNTSFYNTLDAAIINAQNDDTLYIPGGIFTIASTTTIDKRLHIVGVGHDPDSTAATSKSIIHGDIILSSNASGGSITGILLENGPFGGAVFFGGLSLAAEISNFLIERCYLGYIYFLNDGALAGRYSNNTIRQNVIYAINSTGTGTLTDVQSNMISNNVLQYISGLGNNNNILNNIFFSAVASVDGCIINNNIFLQAPFGSNVTNNLINNNLWVINTSIPALNYGTNNLIYLSPMFVDQTGTSFNYSHDYHLQAASPGKNAGIDGTDIGIYGGAFVWVEGSVPSNPHIYFKQIAPQTNSNGQLQIQIKVRTNN